jgi:hypothetical protein
MTERPALLLRIAPTALHSASRSRARRHMKPKTKAPLTNVTPPPAFPLARKRRTATRQDVGCHKLLRQHMYVRARSLMLVRPVRSPLHDVRQHAHDRCFERARISVLMDEMQAAALRPTELCQPTRQDHEGFAAKGWWSQTGSNRRPHACKARALPAELWPLNQRQAQSKRANEGWWAWEDLNFRPHAYQARALTN